MPDVSAGQPPVGGENEARFELLYTAHARRLRAYIAARLGARFHAADDLAQETWVEAWKLLHTLRRGDDAFGWLAAVARRVIVRHCRRGREVATDFGGPHARLLAKAPAAEDVAMVRETTRAMTAVLARTSPLGVAA